MSSADNTTIQFDNIYCHANVTVQMTIVTYIRDSMPLPCHRKYSEHTHTAGSNTEIVVSPKCEHQHMNPYVHLQAALKLSWRSSTKLLIHFGDAPAHGRQYHAPCVHDNYLAGDPSGKFKLAL